MPKAKKKKKSTSEIKFHWQDKEKYKSPIDGKTRTITPRVTVCLVPATLEDAIALSRVYLLTEQEHEVHFSAMGSVSFDRDEEDSPVTMFMDIRPKGKKAMKEFNRFMKKEKEAGRLDGKETS